MVHGDGRPGDGFRFPHIDDPLHASDHFGKFDVFGQGEREPVNVPALGGERL